MTAFNISTHRAIFAKSVNPTENEVLWWNDVQARLLEKLLGTSDVKISLTEPEDTTALWYQPHASNGGNGVFYVYQSASWQVLSASRLFTYLRLKAGFAPGGGGLIDGDYGDIVVSDTGAAMTVDNNVVTNAKLNDMAGYSFKMRNGADTGDPSDVKATELTADTAPASTRILMSFDPATGEPKRSTIAQVATNFILPHIVLEERKDTNTNGGVLVANTRKLRPLSHIVRNEGSLVAWSGSDGAFDLQPGTYAGEFSTTGYNIDRCRAYLRNITDGADIEASMSGNLGATGGTWVGGFIRPFTIASVKTLGIEIVSATPGGAATDMGLACNFGPYEKYCELRLWKVG